VVQAERVAVPRAVRAVRVVAVPWAAAARVERAEPAAARVERAEPAAARVERAEPAAASRAVMLVERVAAPRAAPPAQARQVARRAAEALRAA
jgi:hypothetical protein